MLTIISVHHSLSTLPVGIGNTLATFKHISKLLFQMSVQVYALLKKTEKERKVFFGGFKKVGRIVRYTQEHLVVIRDEESLSFCEIRNNPIPPLLFIRSPYKRIQKSCQKNPVVAKGKI